MFDEEKLAANGGSLLFQMQHALLRVDVHPEVAQEVEAEKAGDLGIGQRVVNHGGEEEKRGQAALIFESPLEF
jgi:hypothetical protein